MMRTDDIGIISNVKIGGKVVVNSNTYLLPANTTKMEVGLGENKKYVISFSYDSDDQSVRYNGSPNDAGGEYTLNLINFSNMFGEGIMEPFPFFIKNNIQHYLSLWVQTNGDKSRVVTITIMKD
ncbi:DUF6864 domain-containing function [Citrobacter braakii]|uniref:DUF6864 domain-containing function n=1 Tax=Citrobacter braakii TaxID=57706 RepID=UPI0031EF0E95